ncbi:MAG: LysR family transcriptional regulator [Hydrogenophaga sp.]|uniref:LysR family transcriptional regulator n=1 Tax=Hydrogenophaga sp. TaxID=1904254 RepID=UPI002ABBC3DE|nr:LysR family transcriptional regulator [Hydrogenophaga sp.]MDZ4188196.1 LysR family transcriptional regulator [Hydrogenophaga sp.]
MEFRHLRCFTVLAQELHFGRAAQRLAMTQPPLSLNIQQLEASVGARLFERNSRGVALTAAGLAFLPRAQALLDQAALAAREAHDVGQGLAGPLHIGFAGTVLYRGLPQVLRTFRSAHPKLRLVLRELSSSEQLAELVHDRLDVGFVHTTRVPAGFSQILVSSQPFMACLPTAHPLAREAVLPLARLQGEAFAVVMRAVSPDYHDRILAACADAGFEPSLHFELRHWLSVVSVIAQGLGVALVPAALQQAGLPGVVFVPLAQPLAPYDTHCLWRTGHDEAALGAFLATVRAAAAPG